MPPHPRFPMPRWVWNVPPYRRPRCCGSPPPDTFRRRCANGSGSRGIPAAPVSSTRWSPQRTRWTESCRRAPGIRCAAVRRRRRAARTPVIGPGWSGPEPMASPCPAETIGLSQPTMPWALRRFSRAGVTCAVGFGVLPASSDRTPAGRCALGGPPRPELFQRRPARRKRPVRVLPRAGSVVPSPNTYRPPMYTAETAASLRLTIRSSPPYWATGLSA